MISEFLTIENQYGRKALSYSQQFLEFYRGQTEESHVLDLCCGYGRHALFLCERQIRVTACDVDKTMIEGLNSYAAAFTRLKTYICNMSELPFQDRTFDGVICYSALHHQCKEQIQKTVSEVKRVCKKGALFSFDILSRNDTTCGVGNEIEPFTYIGGRENEEDIPHHYVDASELRKLLHGFKSFHLQEVTYQYELNNQQMKSIVFCVDAIV